MKEFQRKIKKFGNAMGVTIPAEFLEALGLNKGDTLTFHLLDDAIIMRKAEKAEDVEVDFSEALHYFIENYSELNREIKDC